MSEYRSVVEVVEVVPELSSPLGNDVPPCPNRADLHRTGCAFRSIGGLGDHFVTACGSAQPLPESGPDTPVVTIED